ncbi:MAG TPA: hypothetical protein VJ904_11435 [Tichowtungia sp.]|nr:hypothetical protein [Tichowtungia sp.]
MTGKIKTGLLAAATVCLISGSVVSETAEDETFPFKPLRNPFWPVDYWPENWEAMNADEQNTSMTSGARWETPASQISVTGTSRMGDQTVAIINGEIKEVGDLIEVSHGGRTYQWRLKKIHPEGTVDIERVGIKNKGGAFHIGGK